MRKTLFLPLSSPLGPLPLFSPPSSQTNPTSFPIRNAVFPRKTPGAETLTAPSSISTPSSLASLPSPRSHSLACESLEKWRKWT